MRIMFEHGAYRYGIRAVGSSSSSLDAIATVSNLEWSKGKGKGCTPMG